MSSSTLGAVGARVMNAEISAALRRAAARGTYAPSILNTQPWRFVLHSGELDVLADPFRQLRVLDPEGRQSMLSLGCALFNVRVSLAASMFAPVIERMPKQADPTLVARIEVEAVRQYVVSPFAAYNVSIEQRQTHRQRFTDAAVPDDLLDTLVSAVGAEESILFPVRSARDRLTVTRLCERADELQTADPEFAAEMRAWTTRDPNRRDGVQANALRNPFETALPEPLHQQCLLLLGTTADTPYAWLRAGEALERMWLELTKRGYAASPQMSMIEIAAVRAELRTALRLDWHPHLLIRVGTAPLGPPSLRRPLSDVLTERADN